MPNPIRVVLAEDQRLLREGLSSILRDEPDFELVGEAVDGKTAVELAQKLRPDVVVMDVYMPEMNGLEATRQICSELPDVRVIGLSVNEEVQVTQAMRAAGASAFITKDNLPDALFDAIRSLARSPNAL